MTPGTYLRLRREARGLTIDEVFQEISSGGGALRHDLAAIEADAEPLLIADAKHLDRAIDFDITVLASLAIGEKVGVCRVCACSDCDPCDEICSWTNDAEDLCDNCVGKEAA